MKIETKYIVWLAIVYIVGVGSGALYNQQHPKLIDNEGARRVCNVPLVKPIENGGDQLEKLWKAIVMVESGGDQLAQGPTGDVGIAQITAICLRDCNRIAKYPRWCLDDRMDVRASYEMFKTYLKHYYPNGSMEQRAKLWHRGPSKARQNDKYGDRYWAKVLKVL